MFSGRQTRRRVRQHVDDQPVEEEAEVGDGRAERASGRSCWRRRSRRPSARATARRRRRASRPSSARPSSPASMRDHLARRAARRPLGSARTRASSTLSSSGCANMLASGQPERPAALLSKRSSVCAGGVPPFVDVGGLASSRAQRVGDARRLQDARRPRDRSGRRAAADTRAGCFSKTPTRQPRWPSRIARVCPTGP